MTHVTARQAAARTGQQSAGASLALSGIGLLQVVIIALAVMTALVHLDKALTLGFPFGHPLGIAFGMPSAPHGAASGVAPGALPGHGTGGVTGRAPAGHGPSLPVPLPVLFFLNFLGYSVLIAALYLPMPLLRRYQSVTRWLLIAFAAVTIWGYFAIVGESPNALGAFDKAVEFALILFLLIEAYWLWVVGRSPVSQASA